MRSQDEVLARRRAGPTLAARVDRARAPRASRSPRVGGMNDGFAESGE